jgi:hypothetical protein
LVTKAFATKLVFAIMVREAGRSGGSATTSLALEIGTAASLFRYQVTDAI